MDKYVIDCSSPRRKTRNRIRRFEKSILMLEGLRYFASPKDLANIEKRIQQYKDKIREKELRYGDSLYLCGIKKDISETQRKIHFNKIQFRELNEKINSINSYIESAINPFDFNYIELRIIKSKKEKQRLKDLRIALGKGQSDLKKRLKEGYRSLANLHNDTGKENG